MSLLFSMTICLEKRCSFDLLCVSFVNVYKFECASFPCKLEGWMRHLVLLIPDHCRSV